MSDNYTPLQRNTLDGFGEGAGILYLKLCDVFEAHRSPANERRAFWAAVDYDDGVGGTLDYIFRRNPVHQLDSATISALSRFFAERWRNNFMAS